MAEKIYAWFFVVLMISVCSVGIALTAAQEIEQDKECKRKGGVMVKPWNSAAVCVAAPSAGSQEQE